jgi:hypothetical protein
MMHCHSYELHSCRSERRDDGSQHCFFGSGPPAILRVSILLSSLQAVAGMLAVRVMVAYVMCAFSEVIFPLNWCQFSLWMFGFLTDSCIS